MRVLHVIPSLGPARGGPSVAARLMARAGVIAGHAVDVVASNDNERVLLDVPLETPMIEDGARYIYFARDAYTYTFSRRLGAWLRRHVADYDVVHTHALFSFSTLAAAYVARRRRVPYIVRPLGTLAPYGMSQHAMLKKVSWLLFESRILKNAAAVHFTSTAERDEAVRLGGGWRSEMVPIGIDVTKYDTVRDKAWLRANAPHLADRTTFLFLSRIHPKKRLDLVLAAFQKLNADAPETAMLIAGDGETAYVDALRKRARELGLEHAVHWTGHVTGTEKTAVLRASDIFVLPSINENFGISVVEALASGLPVILSSGVAIHREIESADAGLVSGASPDALAEAMRQMLGNSSRAQMAANARAVAEREFSLEAMASGLTAMYRRVVTA